MISASVVTIAAVQLAAAAPPRPADTIRVAADAFGAWGPAATLIEELRIGSLDGPPELAFGRVTDVAVDARGMIYVVDGQVPVIRVFGPDGVYVGDLGREGQGPGEYLNGLDIDVLPGDSLAVWDSRQVRLSIFPPVDLDARSGSDALAIDPQQVTTIRANTGRVPLTRLMLGRDGEWAVLIHDTLPAPAGGVAPHLVLVFDRSGTEIARWKPPDTNPVTPALMMSVNGVLETNFGTRSFFAYSRQGCLITARNTSYSFDVCERGRLLRVERDSPPVPLTRGEANDWNAITRRATERTDPEMVGGNIMYTVPALKPAFSDLQVDGQGRIWIRPYLAAEETHRESTLRWRQPNAYDVYMPGGASLGRVFLPVGMQLRYQREDHVWGVVHGEFDEQYVVRYRIIPG